MDASKSDVVIVGGGIAGSALALFLKKARLTSAVYEAYPRMTCAGGGLGLAPNGMNVLATLDLAAELLPLGTVISRYEFRNATGRLLAGYSPVDRDTFGQPMLAVSRATLQAVLANAMRAQEIPVHYSKRLVDVEQCADSVIAHFSDGTMARGDLLVGADGVHSSVRKSAFPQAPQPAYTGLVGIGGFAPLAAVPELECSNVLTFMYGRHGFFGYSKLDTASTMWWSNLFRKREYSAAEIRAQDWPVLREELLMRFHTYGAVVRKLLMNTATSLRMNVYDIRSLPAWRHNRVVLIGDAAHAVSPNAGQGAALALEDAQYLAKMLREVPDRAQALARFEHDRKPRAEKIVAEGRRRGADKALVGPVEQKLREILLAGVLRRYGATADRWMYEYKISG